MQERVYEIDPNFKVKVKTDIYTRGIIPAKVSDLPGWEDLVTKDSFNTLKDRLSIVEESDKKTLKLTKQVLPEEQRRQVRDNIDVSSRLETNELLEAFYVSFKKDIGEYFDIEFEYLSNIFKDTLQTRFDEFVIELQTKHNKAINDLYLFIDELWGRLKVDFDKFSIEIDEKIQDFKSQILNLSERINETNKTHEKYVISAKEDFSELETIVRDLTPFNSVSILDSGWEEIDDIDYLFKYNVPYNEYLDLSLIQTYENKNGKERLIHELVELDHENKNISIYSCIKWVGSLKIGTNKLRTDIPLERMRLTTDINDNIIYTDDGVIIWF